MPVICKRYYHAIGKTFLPRTRSCGHSVESFVREEIVGHPGFSRNLYNIQVSGNPKMAVNLIRTALRRR